jgi:excisionase family DNA binding protein
MADEQYLTPAQVAEELQVTTITVRRWIAKGQLLASKAGPRRWMIRRSDVEGFLSDGGRMGTTAEASEDPSFSKHLVAPE